mgnify:CR=1 FL=1
MAFLLKGAHAVDPQVGLDGMADELRVVDASGNPVSLTARTEGSTEGGDADGQVVNQAGGLRTMQWTGEHRPLAAPVVVDGRVVAWALLDDGHNAAVAAHQRTFFWASAATLTAGFLLLLMVVFLDEMSV